MSCHRSGLPHRAERWTSEAALVPASTVHYSSCQQTSANSNPVHSSYVSIWVRTLHFLLERFVSCGCNCFGMLRCATVTYRRTPVRLSSGYRVRILSFDCLIFKIYGSMTLRKVGELFTTVCCVLSQKTQYLQQNLWHDLKSHHFRVTSHISHRLLLRTSHLPLGCNNTITMIRQGTPLCSSTRT